MATDEPANNAPVLAEHVLSLSAEPASLSALHAGLSRFWALVEEAQPGTIDSQWRAHFETAVIEIATNIVRHAYPPETPVRPLRLRLRAYPSVVEACLMDRGRTPDIPTSSPLPEPLWEIPEGHYGLALARASVDELSHARTRRGSNVWRLAKRL